MHVINRSNRVDIQTSAIVVLAVLVSSVMLFFTGYAIAYSNTAYSLKERVYSVYEYLNRSMSKASFQEISKQGDCTKESYVLLQTRLSQVKACTGVKYIYTAKVDKNGRPVYLVDGQTPKDLGFRFPGDPADPAVAEDIRRAAEGEAVLPEKIRDTQRGKVFTAFMPVNQEGKTIGVVGIEFDAAHAYQAQRLFHILAIVIVLLCCAGGTALAVTVFKRISNPNYQDFANTDQLTQLKNRNAYDIDIVNLEASVPREGTGFVVIDLNDLKKANDTYGHRVGDCYIRTVADVLKRCVTNNEVIYRTGGDEFVIIARNTTAERLRELMGNIRQGNECVQIEAGARPSVSMGCAVYERGRDNCLCATFCRADEAMYVQKKLYHEAR